jgi:hypothetical protein
MRAKDKYSFVLDGIKYSDISGYISQYSKDNIVTGVAGTAQMVRQYLKQKYPNIPAKDYVWVNSRSFANGNSIDVYLNNAPEDFYIELKRELNARIEYGKVDVMTDTYTYTKSTETTEDGRKVDYGTKYMSVDNRKPYDSKSPDLTPEDWKRALKKQSQQANPMPKPQRTGRTSGYSMGDTLMECSGWTISKKTLPDGRVVYNAKINPSTGKNTSDWNTIKGEIYTETAFKWGRFGAFEKWGTIASEAAVVQKLCEILGKYYDGGTLSNAPQQEPTGDPSLPDVGDKFKVKTEVGGKIYEIVGMAMGSVDVKPIDEDWVTQFGFTEVKDNFKEGRWVKVKDYNSVPSQPQSTSNIPPNPKLDFVRINYPEGSGAYISLYPREFASFTEATKFIADNIGELEDSGYDKHGVEWKWKFDEEVQEDRWDIGILNNPNKYTNFWAKENMQSMCYQAWMKDTNNINSDFESDDEFVAETLGKEGYELNDEQFNALLTELLTGYKQDVSRFKYNTPQERLERFKSVYPKTYKLFNSPSTGKSKQDIEKAIKGLQYLADNGNEKAIKAIKGLKYLLNK